MPIYGPKINTAFTFYMPVLEAMTRRWLANPAIEEGDFFISKSGGAEASLTNLPVVTNGYYLKFQLTATEMNATSVLIRCHDAYGDEWDDTGEIIFPTAAGSGSGVILTATTSLIVDAAEVANEAAPLIASYLASTLSNFTADEIKQIRYALGVDGTKVATSGGVLDAVYDAVGDITLTSGNVNVEVDTFSAAAETAFKALVFEALTDSGNTLTELSAAPSATPTVAQALVFLNMYFRNERVATSTLMQLKNNAGATIGSQNITDNGSSVIIGEMS